ncbi:MAG: MFS transporter [Pseudomonadota bacterium]
MSAPTAGQTTATAGTGTARNIALYRWLRFFQNLLFWQAIWFLYFQQALSASEAILLYAIYDIGTTALEVPSGYLSDRIGRRLTLVASGAAGLAGGLLLALGESFAAFAVAQVLLGASAAFASGTDSAMLYESLAAEGREGEVEQAEVVAWRWGFAALALSAFSGGLMAVWQSTLPFYAGAAAFAGMLVVALRLSEPPHTEAAPEEGGELARLSRLGGAFREPVLLWLFMLSLLMYGFSHIPFVFGQPFIETALEGAGFAAEAPAVSGAVTTAMMMLSLLASFGASQLRRRIELGAILLLAFGMQIALAGTLALTNDAIAIALLFLRMVPDALSRPFILARIQPMLASESRATYLSLQSFGGRLLFAGSLFLASMASSGEGEMRYAEIQGVLAAYTVVGLAALLVLMLTARRLRLEPDDAASSVPVGGRAG